MRTAAKKRSLRDLPVHRKPPVGWLRPREAAKAWGRTEEAVHAAIRHERVKAVRVFEGQLPRTYVAPEKPADGRRK